MTSSILRKLLLPVPLSLHWKWLCACLVVLLLTSFSLAAQAQSPTVATAAAASANPVTGTTTNLSVLGADSGGEANLTYTWTVNQAVHPPVTFTVNGTNAAKNTSASFSQPGDYPFRVTIQNGAQLTCTSDVVVHVVRTLTAIIVSPARPSVPAYAELLFRGTAKDQFGKIYSTQPAFTWSIDAGGTGRINPSSGFYSADIGTGSATTGSATVRATIGNLSGATTVSITTPVLYQSGTTVPNPQVPQGGSNTFQGSDEKYPSDGTWDILDPTGIVIATSVTHSNWTVTVDSADNLTVAAPGSASVAANYEVRALSQDGTYADSASFDVIAVSQVPAPTALTALAGNTVVLLSWTAPAGTVTGYNVYRGTASGNETLLSPSSGPTYTDNTAGNDTFYYYRVTALMAGGESAPSNEVTATLQSSPPYYDVGANSSTESALAWATSPGFASYNIKRGTVSGTYTSVVSITSPSTSVGHYLDPNLISGTTYYYTVSAVGQDGQETANAPEIAVMLPASANPQIPQSQAASLPSSGYDGPASGTWDIVSPQGQVVASSDNPGTWNVSNDATFTVTAGSSAPIGSGYEVRFVDGSPDTPDDFRSYRFDVVLPIPPVTPTGLTATADTSPAVALTWNAVSAATGYNVKRGTTQGGPYTAVASNVSDPNYYDISVTSGTTYYYVVTAVNGNAESGNSNAQSARPFAQTQATPGGSATFFGDGDDNPASGTWDIVSSSGSVIATSTNNNGWTVTVDRMDYITVGVPASSTVGTGYKVRSKDPDYNFSVSSTFDVLSASSP